MNKYRRIGIILILLGIFIILISSVFANGYNPVLGFWWSVSEMEITLWDKNIELTKHEKDLAAGKTMPLTDYDRAIVEGGRQVRSVVLPYKYTFSLGLCLIFMGFAFLILTTPKKAGDR